MGEKRKTGKIEFSRKNYLGIKRNEVFPNVLFLCSLSSFDFQKRLGDRKSSGVLRAIIYSTPAGFRKNAHKEIKGLSFRISLNRPVTVFEASGPNRRETIL
jgi:hypothetical protein